MAKRKTVFELVDEHDNFAGKIEIKEQGPYMDSGVKIMIPPNDKLSSAFIRTEDLETFALNILKALKSKHLKP